MQTSIDSAQNELLDFFEAHPRLAILTGAGISEGSGIPTYRDSEGNWLRNDPITHQEFTGCEQKRRRYWGRSLVGWPGVRDARPNAAHQTLATLEREERIELLITQNVDRLHQRAGSCNVVDLHGRLDRVICLACKAFSHRELMQQRLERHNPHLRDLAVEVRPDGDADLSIEQVTSVVVPVCDACGGDLMPDVVFFGGSVPRERVAHCTDAIARADALLVIGSSLRVFSGYRFCRRAAEAGKPIAILNPGVTRADPLATLKLSHPAEMLLPPLLGVLSRGAAGRDSGGSNARTATDARIHKP
ncbi:MAG: NAD-dependent protein deacetylase [Chromatocurvus sp.]